jgi:hypothetical protein
MVLMFNFLNSATSRVQPSASAMGSLLAEEPPRGGYVRDCLTVEMVTLTNRAGSLRHECRNGLWM